MRRLNLASVVAGAVALIAVIAVAPALFADSKSLDPAVSQPPAPPANPTPPKDAQWTIYCQVIAGPDHVERANQAKDALLKTTPLKDWYVIHNENESVIYYGFYRSIDNPKDSKEAARAHTDLAAITKNIQDRQHDPIFARAFFTPITSPDPFAPPQWDLRNAKGFWSLEIGVYKDNPMRKQAAVDAVRAARKQGIEAYYYHGPTASSVCIGCWPREAVKEQDESSAMSNDPDEDVLVLPQPIDIPGNVKVRDRQGRPVRTLVTRVEYNDPSLAAMVAKYPTHAINGVVYTRKGTDKVTGQVREFPDSSLLVQIPHEAPSILRDSAPPPSLVAPTAGDHAPGEGKLRSIGQ